MQLCCIIHCYVIFLLILFLITVTIQHLKDLMRLHIFQTAALDGETDLKTRVIPPACMGIDLELLHKIKARFHS